MKRSKFSLFERVEFYENLIEERELEAKKIKLELDNLHAEYTNKRVAEELKLDIELNEKTNRLSKETQDLVNKLETTEHAAAVKLAKIDGEVKAQELKLENLKALEAERRDSFEASAAVLKAACTKEVDAANKRAEAAEKTIEKLIAMLPKVDLKDLSVSVKTKCGKE